MKKILWFLSDRISILIPLLLTLAIAVFTYWLAQQDFGIVTVKQKKLAPEVPDVYLTDLTLRGFNLQGQKILAVKGQTANYNSRLDIVSLDSFNFSQHQPDGSMVEGKSAKAKVNLLEDKVLTMLGDVEIEYKNALNPSKLSGEKIHFNYDKRQVYADLPIKFQQHNKIVTANSLNYSDITESLKLAGRVKISLTQ